MQQRIRENRELREHKTIQLYRKQKQLPLRRATTPSMSNKGEKQASPPIKIGKTKQVLGKTVLGKIQEVGKIKTHKPNLKN